MACTRRSRAGASSPVFPVHRSGTSLPELHTYARSRRASAVLTSRLNMVSGAVKEPCQRSLRLHLAEPRLEFEHAAASGPLAALRLAGQLAVTVPATCTHRQAAHVSAPWCAQEARALRSARARCGYCARKQASERHQRPRQPQQVCCCSMRGALHVTMHASRLGNRAPRLLRSDDCECLATHTQTSTRTLLLLSGIHGPTRGRLKTAAAWMCCPLRRVSIS